MSSPGSKTPKSRRGCAVDRVLAKVIGCLALVCVAAALFGGQRAEAATETTDLQIGATIGIRCTVIATPLSFGNYAITDPTPLDVQGAISLNCTQSNINFVMNLRLDQGLHPAAGSNAAAPRRQMSDGAGNVLRYYIYRNAARTQVWGNTGGSAVFPGTGPYPMLVPVYGRIPALQHVEPGTYADTVVATLHF